MPGKTASKGRPTAAAAQPSMSMSKSQRTHAAAAAAVSATKKRARRTTPEKLVRAPVSPCGELCIALYRPKKLRKTLAKHKRKGIWWPALRFPSIGDFQKTLEANLLRNGAPSHSSTKSLEWSSQRKKEKNRKKLVQKVCKETLSGNPIETLCYLGRPLEEYVTADDAVKTGIEIQGFPQGLGVLTDQAKTPGFPKLFGSGDSNTAAGPADNHHNHNRLDEGLFRDYYAALDETMVRYDAESDSDDSDSDSDNDSDSEDEEESAGSGQASQNKASFQSMGQTIWANYLQRGDEPEDEPDSSDAEGSPKPLMEAGAVRNHPESEDEDEEQDHPPHPQEPQDRPHAHAHAHHHHPHDDASIAAQSAAAVSYTEASLMSASKGGGAQAAPPPVVAPPDLSDEVIAEGDDFETIWHKHQMEGWDRYLQEDVADGTETMVYEAPNGYRFDTHKDFCHYLAETYGFCGMDEPLASPPKPAKATKPRGRSAKPRSSQTDENRRSSSSHSRSRSRSRSRSQDHGGLQWKTLWAYLSGSLDWTYNWATQKDIKKHGMSSSVVWFRPGFDMKHRGKLGRDHFVNEDDVMRYCLERNIRPTDDDSSSEVHSDDAGYSTPDDQSTVPQDPGKPRLPTPPGTASSGASGNSGGSYYSYDNDPDRYVFTKLWARLKEKGWAWHKPKNCLDDYWYIRPASIRPVSQWIRGTDYFLTEEEVIQFCKDRDLMSMKEREKRRNERLLKQQRDRENSSHSDDSKEEEESQSSSKDTTDNGVQTKPKKRGRGRPRKDKSSSPQVQKRKKQNATDKDQLSTKSSKKSKAAIAKKRRREKPPRPGFSVEDKNLIVDAKNSSGNVQKPAPWVRNVPRYEHKLCINATRVTWLSHSYYLPGEDRSNHSVRFQNVGDVARHFALNPQTLLWASGEKTPANEDERSFQRLIRYALVPGVQSSWSQIRKISRSETSFLLRKLGYKNSNGTSWEPPEALVAMGDLQQDYPSLESLCEALWCLKGDLKTPPSAETRRRRQVQELDITPTQFMALRLRIAEGFSDSEDDEEEEEEEVKSAESDSDTNQETSGKKQKQERIPENQPQKASAATSPEASTEEADTEDEQQFYLSPSEKQIDDSAQEEEKSVYLTPSEQKMKEFAEDEDQQLAMSPSKIKVGKFRKNPEDNTAPWAVNPLSAPKGGWSKMYYKMGFTYQNGYYYLPEESLKTHTKRFSKVEDIRHHICLEGNYRPYLEKLNQSERKLVRRHFDYGNVPGIPAEWRKLRELDTQETILFLNLLGFEKAPGEYGWWQIPKGVPILEQQSYPTFSVLCKALVRLPDLEDRAMGMSNRRRSRKKEEDLVLSDYQMMALRLRLAEGFEDEDEVVIEDRHKQVEEEKKLDEQNDFVDQFAEDTQNHKDAWKFLKNLGCTYNGRYYVPGNSLAHDTQNEMVEFILKKSVKVLDWEHCTLDAEDIKAIERYLKAFHARSSDLSLAEETLKMVTKENIRNCLGKIGVNELDGKYYNNSEQYSESDIINMIRRTNDLNFLCRNEMTPIKRRRSRDDELLSKQETLILRLWAACDDTPLTNMPEASLIGRANREVSKPRGAVDDTGKENGTEALQRVTSPSKTDVAPTKHLATNDSGVNSHVDQLEDSQRQLDAEPNSESADPSSTMELEESAFAEENYVTGSAKKRQNALKSPEKPVQMDLEEANAAVATSLNQRNEIEQASNVNPSPTKDHGNQLLSSLVDESAEKTVTEKASTSVEATSNEPQSGLAPVERSVQIDLAETGTIVDTDTNQPKDKEGTVQTNPAPLQDSAIESASKLAKFMMQASSAPSTSGKRSNEPQRNDKSAAFVPRFAGGLTTPSPRKKRRRSKKEKQRTDSSPRGSTPLQSTQGLSEFFTPNETNVEGQPSIEHENVRMEFGVLEPAAALPDRSIASRTASSHKEAFGNSLAGGLMTQPTLEDDEHRPCGGAGDDNLLDMDHSAQLDFDADSPVFSPEAVVATKRIKPSQHYGSRYGPNDDQHDDGLGEDISDFLTQDEDVNWLDRPLPH